MVSRIPAVGMPMSNGQQHFRAMPSLVDLKAAINMGVVDVSLPAKLVLGFQSSSMTISSLQPLLTDSRSICRARAQPGIMDGAGPYNYEKTLIVAAHDCGDLLVDRINAVVVRNGSD